MDESVAGDLRADPGVLRTVARLAAGREHGEVAAWQAVPADHVVDNLTTAALHHVSGTFDDGTQWSAFAKALRPASASPAWSAIPPEHHEAVLRNLDWLDEPRVYRSALAGGVAPAIRLPRALAVDEDPAGDRIVLWLEAVADHGPWDLDRYRRTAAALGRAAGRWPGKRVEGELGLGRRDLGYLFFGKVTHADLPTLFADATWAAPTMAEATAHDPTLRADLAWLAEAASALVLTEPDLPHGLAHGDAAPANFHEPGDGVVVALDWSYGCSGPLGADLAQLLTARTEAGQDDPAALDDLAEVTVAAYREGLADEGVDVDPSVLARARAAHLVARSGLSTLVGAGPDAAADLLRARAAVARLAVEEARRALV